MDNDYALGYCLIKVICLIVIAISVHKLASSKEYMSGNNTLVGAQRVSVPNSFGTANGVRFYSDVQQSMFNNAEPPVFWNMGSVEETNEALQAAASMGPDKMTYGDTSVAPTAGFGNRSFAEGDNLNQKLGNAIIGL